MFAEKLINGDTIGIFCASEPANLVQERINLAESRLAQLGLNVEYAPNCFLTGYVAGSIIERSQAFMNLYKNPNIKALMAFWGGNNSNEILPFLDYNYIEQNPKIVIGYSDTSVILQAITNMTQLVTYYGASLVSFSKPIDTSYSLQSFESCCVISSLEDHSQWLDLVIPETFYDNSSSYQYGQNPESKLNEGIKVYKNGESSGTLVSCCLESLCALIGTSYFPNLDNVILSLESSERSNIRNIRQYFTQMIQCGYFDCIKGLCLSKFTADSKVSEEQLIEILDELFAQFDFPIIYNLDFGHTDPIGTLPNGSFVDIKADSQNGVKIKFKIS